MQHPLRSFLFPFFVMLLSVFASSAYAQTTVTNQTVGFWFTGAPQTYTVPANTYSITIDAHGAPGSRGFSSETGVYFLGGKGARVQATLAVTPGQVLTIYVGGTAHPQVYMAGSISDNSGGYNGGGSCNSYHSYFYSGPGGGASDVRTGSATLADRVLVAGGGGGGGVDDRYRFRNGELSGGDGGTPNGGNGHVSGTGPVKIPHPSEGATQTSGFALGQGGGATYTCCQQAGGGGGYYGGYASNPAAGGSGGGGGGGSSWVTPTGSSNVQMTTSSGGHNGVIFITPNQSVAAPTLTSLSPTSGPVGTSVTITGTNLDGATGVTFNGTAVTSFTVNSATQITATVPTDATTGDVVVNTPDGASNGVSFTVLALVAPTITFADISKTFGEANFNLAASSNSSGAITYSVVSGTGATVSSGGEVTITGAGSVQIKAVQAANGSYTAGEKTITLTINKAEATITLTAADLNQTYSGTGKSVGYSINPAGVTGVSITYSQGGNAVVSPTNAGSYSVVASLENNNYTATNAAGTLVIGKAPATVTLGSLTPTYTGSPLAATATTTPSGLPVNFTYDGAAQAPTNAGSYAVVGTINDANYEGSASGTMVIGKASATITLTGADLNQTYSGTAKMVGYSISPTGVTGVSVTYSQGGNTVVSPTAAGSYSAVASLTNNNYTATNAAGTLVIGKATPTVTPTVGTYTYTGSAQGPDAATNTGTGGSYTFSYAGVNGTTYAASATKPTHAGSYTVTATVAASTDGNYSSASSSASAFSISPAEACVTYNGELFKNTAVTTGGSATVRLSVVVAKSPSTAPGSINTATVVFLVDGKNVTATVDNSNTTASQITYYANVTLSLGNTAVSNSWEVDWIIGGNYTEAASGCSDDGALVTISSLSSDFSTGGGYTLNSGSTGKVGIKTNEVASKNNFGYDVKWNKQLSNLQGHFHTNIRSGGRMYQVKSNKASYLQLSTDKKTATITYINAVLSDVTSTATGTCDGSSPVLPGCSDGGGTVVLVVTDNGEPGTLDGIAMTIKDKNGAIFYQTSARNLLGGNIQVRTSTTTTSPTTSAQQITVAEQTLAPQQGMAEKLTAAAYPNPSVSQFTLKLTSDNTRDAISVRVINQMGKVVEVRSNLTAGQTIQLGSAFRPGVYFVDILQGKNRKQVKLIKTQY